MWWAVGVNAPAGHPGPLVWWVHNLPLNGLPRKPANADGGPAADGFEKNLKQLVAEYERAGGMLPTRHPEGTFLRSRP